MHNRNQSFKKFWRKRKQNKKKTDAQKKENELLQEQNKNAHHAAIIFFFLATATFLTLFFTFWRFQLLWNILLRGVMPTFRSFGSIGERIVSPFEDRIEHHPATGISIRTRLSTWCTTRTLEPIGRIRRRSESNSLPFRTMVFKQTRYHWPSTNTKDFRKLSVFFNFSGILYSDS